MPKKKTGANVPVGQRIKKARTEKKIALESVANDTGISTDSLKKIEGGKMTPPVGTLLQIAKALEIDSGFLFREQENSRRSGPRPRKTHGKLRLYLLDRRLRPQALEGLQGGGGGELGAQGRGVLPRGRGVRFRAQRQDRRSRWANTSTTCPREIPSTSTPESGT